MDFAKLLRDAFRETIGFVGACIFYVVAPLRWPRHWAERVCDPATPSAQGYVETRLFFFLSVAAWIVLVHVFLPPVGADEAGPTGELVEVQRQQIFDSFVQAFAGGVRGAAATGMAIGALLATAMLDAWLRLRGGTRASATRVDLIVVALGVVNLYVFVIARAIAYVAKEPLAALLTALSRAAVETAWPWPIKMALTVGAGGVARNSILACVVCALAALHVAMAWVLLSPLRLPAAKDEPDNAYAGAAPLVLAGFAALCAGLLASEAIREGRPRLSDFALLPQLAKESEPDCAMATTLVNDSERPVLLTRAQQLELRLRVAQGGGQWSHPIDLAAEVVRLNGKAEDALLVKPGETALVVSTPLRFERPQPRDRQILQHAAMGRFTAEIEVWLTGGGRAIRLAPVLRPAKLIAECLDPPDPKAPR